MRSPLLLYRELDCQILNRVQFEREYNEAKAAVAIVRPCHATVRVSKQWNAFGKKVYYFGLPPVHWWVDLKACINGSAVIRYSSQVFSTFWSIKLSLAVILQPVKSRLLGLRIVKDTPPARIFKVVSWTSEHSLSTGEHWNFLKTRIKVYIHWHQDFL